MYSFFKIYPPLVTSKTRKTHNLFKTLSDDHQTLAEVGFLGPDELHDRYRDVRIVSYDPRTEKLVLEHATALIEQPAAAPQQMIEITAISCAGQWSGEEHSSENNTNVSLLVAPGHYVYVLHGRQVRTGNKVNWDGRQ